MGKTSFQFKVFDLNKNKNMPLEQKDILSDSLNEKELSEKEQLAKYAVNLAEEDDLIVENIFYKKKSWYGKWWGILIILVVFLLLIWGVFFISLTQDYLHKIEVGSIHYDMKYRTYDFSTKADLLAITKTEDDPQWGNPDAKVTIVEFADFTCPYCKDFNNEFMPKLKEEYADRINFIFRDYPILSGLEGESMQIANLANCIYNNLENKDDYWKVHNYIFLMAGNLMNINNDFEDYYDSAVVDQCVNEERYYNEILQDYYVADELGIQGTPTFYVNGHLMRANIPMEEWEYLLDKFLEKNK